MTNVPPEYQFQQNPQRYKFVPERIDIGFTFALILWALLSYILQVRAALTPLPRFSTDNPLVPQYSWYLSPQPFFDFIQYIFGSAVHAMMPLLLIIPLIFQILLSLIFLGRNITVLTIAVIIFSLMEISCLVTLVGVVDAPTAGLNIVFNTGAFAFVVLRLMDLKKSTT